MGTTGLIVRTGRIASQHKSANLMRPAFLFAVRVGSDRERARRQQFAPMPSGHSFKERLRFVAKTGRILTRRLESLVRIFMLVVSGAIMLVAQLNDGSAAGGSGPFDGQWAGSATSTVEQCKSAKVIVTVEGMMVVGQAQFANDAPKINGTVRGDGSFGATIGWQPLTGKFNPDGFEGTFKDGDCEWKIDLQRAQPLNVRN
jgi:hypothetical protein